MWVVHSHKKPCDCYRVKVCLSYNCMLLYVIYLCIAISYMYWCGLLQLTGNNLGQQMNHGGWIQSINFKISYFWNNLYRSRGELEQEPKPFVGKVAQTWFVNNAEHELNFYHSLGKQDLTFHANCLHWRQCEWNVKSCFLGKIRKYFKISNAENFTQSAKS